MATDTKAVDLKAAEASPWRKYAPLLGVIVIVLYCLAPFYWMVVSAFRRPLDQFDNSLIPAPFSLDNLQSGLRRGRRLRPGPAEQPDRGRHDDDPDPDRRADRRVHAGPAGVPVQERGAGDHHHHVDVPGHLAGGPAAQAVHRHQVDQHLPGDDRAQPVVRAAAGGVDADHVLPADAAGTGAGGDGGRLYPGAGVPQGRSCRWPHPVSSPPRSSPSSRPGTSS